ncbi:MAG: class I SAM-dependent methyltransferase [Clostridia bacterium]|nr:class I SAM-dependent methyltransferase [Clostridia bacterium]NCC45049.1 class I SAM-dependent methyltransferase [Clostridia bacterium]
MDSIDYYNRYAVPYYEETVDVDMGEVMQPFVDLLPENAEVLDLGCGSGRDTIVLEEKGFYVTPMDGSEEMCKLAEINTDQEVLQMTYEEMDFDDVFDGIWACASLVHLTEDEMRETLGKLVQALKKGGVLYFSVHKGERDGIYNGRYFRDYSKRELSGLIEEFSELELINIWSTQDVRSSKSDKVWLNVLVKKVNDEK